MPMIAEVNKFQNSFFNINFREPRADRVSSIINFKAMEGQLKKRMVELEESISKLKLQLSTIEDTLKNVNVVIQKKKNNYVEIQSKLKEREDFFKNLNYRKRKHSFMNKYMELN